MGDPVNSFEIMGTDLKKLGSFYQQAFDWKLGSPQPAYTMAAAIANEFSEATTATYQSALMEVGLILFVVTVAVNAVARILIWRVARGAAVGSRAL